MRYTVIYSKYVESHDICQCKNIMKPNRTDYFELFIPWLGHTCNPYEESVRPMSEQRQLSGLRPGNGMCIISSRMKKV
jgi:hypothetical protein